MNNQIEWDGMPMPSRLMAIVAVVFAVGMAVLDGVIVNIALPTICDGLNISSSQSVLIVNSYQLSIIITLIPFSALGDVVGYRKIYIPGLCLFTLMSVGCALSWSLSSLVVCRILQGLGASAVMSVNTSLVRLIYPKRMLGRGLGINSTVVSVLSVAGPTIAAGLLMIAEWPILFVVNIPFAVVAIILSCKYLPYNPLLSRRFTWPFDLFKIPIFRLSVLTSICSFVAQMSTFVAMPFILQRQFGYSTLEVGAMITAWPIVNLITTPIAGVLVDRYHAGRLGSIGLVALTLGMGLLASMPDDPSSLDIMVRLAICGFGFGLFQAPNNNIIITSAPLQRSGSASGMMASARLAGQIIGAGSVALLFTIVPDERLTDILYIGAISSAIAMVISLLRLSLPLPKNVSFG